MPDFTNMTLECYGTTPSPGVQDFRVEATVTVGGELPTTAVFVYTVGDEDDSATDSFARIANPQDLQNVKATRAAAVSASESEYLASYAAFQYADIDVAIGAKAMLKGRVNSLVKDWIKYNETFLLDTGVSKSYPSSDPSVQDDLEATYADAKAARVDAEVVVVDTDAALTASRATVDSTQALITSAKTCTDFISTFSTHLYAYTDNVISENSDATSIRLNYLYPLLTSRGAVCSGELQTQINNKAAAEAAVATATMDKIEAEQELAAAQAAEDAALAAVLAVCPEFDPSSV